MGIVARMHIPKVRYSYEPPGKVFYFLNRFEVFISFARQVMRFRTHLVQPFCSAHLLSTSCSWTFYVCHNSLLWRIVSTREFFYNSIFQYVLDARAHSDLVEILQQLLNWCSVMRNTRHCHVGVRPDVLFSELSMLDKRGQLLRR